MLDIQPTKKDIKRPISNTAHIPPLLLLPLLANLITPYSQPIKKIVRQINNTTQPCPPVTGSNNPAIKTEAKISIIIILYFTDFQFLQQLKEKQIQSLTSLI